MKIARISMLAGWMDNHHNFAKKLTVCQQIWIECLYISNNIKKSLTGQTYSSQAN